MSVQSEIDRIEQNVANTYAVLGALGADMPAEQNSDNLATTAGTAKAVLYSAQTLTEAQKAQARANIGINSALFTSIPKIIHIVVGKEFRMYYKNVISNPNCRLWLGSASGITVRRYAEYLSITAEDACDKNIAWKIYDNSFNVVDSGTMQVVGTAEKANTAKILVIGDSTVTQSNSISQKLLDCFSAAGGSLTLLGTRGTAPALHEGRAGWSAKNYCTSASFSSLTNPFYNNGFNFSYYMTQQGYSGVDIVVIQLGINDIFSMTFENFTATETANYIQQMVSSIVGYDSNIKVIVNLLSVPNGNGTSFTDTHGTSQIDFINLVNSIRMSKALIEKFADSAYVTISPNNCVLDPNTDINDGVHPLIPTGYEKLGQAIYETINGIFDGSGGESGGTLWNLNSRTLGSRPAAGRTATQEREMKPEHYYYLDAYTGVCVATANFTVTDYLATSDALEFTVNAANGTSASSLSACGVSVPLALEVGKSYTFTAQAANANMGVRLVTYTANGDNWVYSANTPICYNSTALCSITITPEAGKGYAINFSQKSAGVGTKNVFTNISLSENS